MNFFFFTYLHLSCQTLQIPVMGAVKFLIAITKFCFMKSKAQIKGHPLHPILVAFPIAFFTGAFLFDLAGLILQRQGLHTTAMYLNGAGIAGGLAAAIPGIIDYIHTVPPASTAKERATKHALLNTINIVLFIAIFYIRRNGSASAYLITALEMAGIVILSIAGWMGGTLVYRNQIGVDPRYAFAGKWKEKYIDPTDGPIELATADELKPNQMQLIHIGGKRIVLARTESHYVAFDDHCTHRGGSLAAGAMMCGTVQCPWHGSQFDVETGGVKAGPAKEKIKTYHVTESAGKIVVEWVREEDDS
jgi:nitrite reductase/ring-hydroxylating ferredoxin subunit/uncharacterized membrane protein